MQKIRVHFAVADNFLGLEVGEQSLDSAVPHKYGILPVNRSQRQAVSKSGVPQCCYQNWLHLAQKNNQGRTQNFIKTLRHRIPHIWH